MNNEFLSRIRTTFVVVLILVLQTAATLAMDGSSHVAGMLLGGKGRTHVTDMKQLSNRNVAVCGWTTSNALNYAATGAQRINAGSSDAFVAIASPMLDTVLFLTFLGGLQDDKAICLDVDARDRILIVGETSSTELPVTQGAFRQTYSSDVDGFAAWLSPDLARIERCTYIPGSGSDRPKAVTLDAQGHVFICGSTTSAIGFPTNSGYRRSAIGGSDAFVIKLDSSLSIVQLGTYFGSEINDAFEDIRVSADGKIACVGWTESTSYETYPRVDPTMWWLTRDRPYDWTYNGGNTDAVLTVLSSDGARLLLSTYLGGSGADTATVVEFDGVDRPVIFGHSTSADFPSPGGAQTRGGADVFVSVMGNEGRVLRSTFMFGGSGDDRVTSASRASFGSWIIAGTSTSWDLEAIGQGANQIRSGHPSGMIGVCTDSDVQFLTFVSGGGADNIVAARSTNTGDVLFSGFSTSDVIPILPDPPLRKIGETTGFVGLWAFGTLRTSMPTEDIRLCLPDSLLLQWNADGMRATDVYAVERSVNAGGWLLLDSVAKTSYTWVPTTRDTIDASISFRVRTSRGHTVPLGGLVLVDPPLVISQLPAVASGCRGQEITVPLSIEGRISGLQWFLNGRTLDFNTTPLVIDALTSTTAGEYHCEVTAACGTVLTSTPVRVVIAEPPSINREPEDVVALIGGSATLRVDANNTTSFTWRKVGVPDVLGIDSVLQLQKLEPGDAGEYYCVLRGACDTLNTRHANIVVDSQTSVLDISDQVEPEEQIFSIRGERLDSDPRMLPRGLYLICRTDGFGRVKCTKRLVLP